MRSTILPTALALALPAASMYDDWHFGNMFTLGPTSDDVAITKATYSLVPPAVPCGSKQTKADDAPWLSIWIGVSGSMSDQTADLFQPLLNWSPDQESQACPATDKEWCVATSTYHLSGQVQEPYVTVPNDSEIEFTISIENNQIQQSVTIADQTVSSQSDSKSISPKWLYSSNECYLNTCGLVDSYTWRDLTIHLSGADPHFGETLTLMNATSEGLTTSDGGKTWSTKGITIQQDHFEASGAGEGCDA